MVCAVEHSMLTTFVLAANVAMRRGMVLGTTS